MSPFKRKRKYFSVTTKKAIIVIIIYRTQEFPAFSMVTIADKCFYTYIYTCG